MTHSPGTSGRRERTRRGCISPRSDATMLIAARRPHQLSGLGPGRVVVAMDPQAIFDESEVRAAEHRLEAALEAVDPTAWVLEYTEDAVFDGGGEHAVIGRDSLLTMASSMTPLRSVSIRPLRTEGHGALAAVWVEGLG